MTRSWRIGAGLVALLTCAVAACGGDTGGASPAEMARSPGGAAAGTVTLIGAGATFPYPIYSKWFDAYGRTHPVRVNYQSIGSGGGIRQLTEGTVDFGASDAPMTGEEMGRAPGTLHLPTVVGAVAVTYNLPSVRHPIRLTGPVLGEIFTGAVRKWSAPQIQQLNPGVALPDRDILVVHRSDGSGTTYVFTDYLSTVSPAWRQRVGTGKSVDWPVGLGAKGNEGVAGQVRQMEGAIGYVEHVYAQQNDLATAALRNRAGRFVRPSLEATTAAAAGAADGLPADTDFRVSLVDTPGPRSYPIAAWTYLLVPRHMADCGRARALAQLMQWTSSAEGDRIAEQLGYAPLPASLEEKVRQGWRSVTCGPDDQPVLQGS